MKLLNIVILLNGVFSDEPDAESATPEPEILEELLEEIPSIKVSRVAHLDITVNGEALGTVDIGLFADQVPKTVKNFESLCEGWENPADDEKHQYGGTKIHRISPGFIIQAGDIIKNDGTGSISIYGETFEDENFLLKHYDEGWLSMANNGPDSNGCQFFLLLDEADFLDGQHVVFGKVIYGMNVLKDLEKQPLTVDPDYQEYFEEYPEDYEDELEFPINDVRIDACYLSDPEEDMYVELKHKEKTEEPEDYELPGEDEEVFPEDQPVDTEEFQDAETLDYEENYKHEEL